MLSSICLVQRDRECELVPSELEPDERDLHYFPFLCEVIAGSDMCNCFNPSSKLCNPVVQQMNNFPIKLKLIGVYPAIHVHNPCDFANINLVV